MIIILSNQIITQGLFFKINKNYYQNDLKKNNQRNEHYGNP
jgi:hypothetical protein